MKHFTKIAEKYLSAGLCVLPADRKTKSPRVGKWSSFKKRLPSPNEISVWFRNNHDAMCIVCGEVSGNLELLDFDDKASMFDAWAEKVPADLLKRLVIETTQSGGKHIFYRCESKVCGSIKLAQRRIEIGDQELIRHKGKEYVRHNDKKYQVSVDEDGVMFFIVTQIETRGEGGLFLCDPTDGYEIVQGDVKKLPVISQVQRDLLLTAAWELNSHVPAEQVYGKESYKAVVDNNGNRPGDEFNVRGDFRSLLENHGWTLISASDGNEYWRRPGKTGRAWSATYSQSKKVFYVFSSSVHPLQQNKGYSPFGLYAMLEHGGDYTAAASKLHTQGYGTLPTPSADDDVDLSNLLASVHHEKSEREVEIDSFWERPPYVASNLCRSRPPMNAPIIHGLLREGETMNLIAPPKTGKSWLACDLGIAVARGDKWLNKFATEPGRVLLMDNELHLNNISNRLIDILEARNIPADTIDHLHVKPLRGHLQDLHVVASYLNKFEKGYYKLVILDAFYRFLSDTADENDNAAISGLYNLLDKMADRLGCAFVLVHHTSKGIQAGKAVTDVGSGAGAQSRAADTHSVLRKHQEEGVIVFDAAVRSWKPVKPVTLKWHFPVWNYDSGYDPEDLEGAIPNRKKKEAVQKTEAMSVEDFVEHYFSDEKKTRDEIFEIGKTDGLSRRQISHYLEEAQAKNLLFKYQPAVNKKSYFSQKQPPQED